jgi:hypothetical protein
VKLFVLSQSRKGRKEKGHPKKSWAAGSRSIGGLVLLYPATTEAGLSRDRRERFAE